MPTGAYEVAEQLLQNATTEDQFRAAASRAYYAAFQHLRDHPAVKFTPKNIGADHQDLISHLKQSNDTKLKRLGIDHMPRLRKLRNWADYDLKTNFSKGIAEDAVDLATDVIFNMLP